MSSPDRSTRSFERSLAWQKRADAVILGGGQAHKRARLPGPLMIERGEGCRFWDADGAEYIDYLMAYGPVVLGYGCPRVLRAVSEQCARGNVFNVGHTLEIELAEKLVDIIPSAERVTFCVGGSDGTAGAVKIARAYTGREKVVRCGYHGWHDWCHSERGALLGTAAYTLSMTYNDLGSLEALFDAHRGGVACVIMEPCSYDAPLPGYLEGVARLCHDNGALFILDEVKTGFRYALGGAQERFGVTPDMSVFSKAMGNGFGIAAVVGSAEVMDAVAGVWVAATFHGEMSLVAAALATIAEIEEKDGIAHMWRLGGALLDGYREMTERLGVENVRLEGAGPIPFFGLTGGSDRLDKMRASFYRETLDGGLYLPEGHIWFLSLAHTDEDIARTLDVSETALRKALTAA